MPQRLAHVSLLVRDYDEALAFYVGQLGFRLLEDTDVGAGKRWVRVSPPGEQGTSLLLARAATARQSERVGDQTGGRVFLFLQTDDFWRDYHDLRAAGVDFNEAPRLEDYGTVAVFIDLYGNRWDLLQMNDGSAPPEMSARDVVAFLDLADAHGIGVCVDGGWGVDALLGEQTRRHADLDIAVQHADVPRLRLMLAARGYVEIQRADTRDCNFVLGDGQGRRIDVHSYTFAVDGRLLFGVPYPAESLAGSGSILDRPVRCITPEWMVRFHSGYLLDADDLRDVRLLCQRFGIDIPPEHVLREQELQRQAAS